MSENNDDGPDDLSSGFSEWYPLTHEGLELHAVDAPAAVQLSRADRKLVPYPRGKSAMVFYFYAARSAKEALKRLFAEELDEPGERGQGPLVFRTMKGGDAARLHLEKLYFEFEERFGSAPILHVTSEE
jgi:hypothetical protein